MPRKELWFEAGELFVADLGGVNMERIQYTDLDTFFSTTEEAIAFAAGTTAQDATDDIATAVAALETYADDADVVVTSAFVAADVVVADAIPVALAAGTYPNINAAGINVTATARTATVDGLTTGVVAAGTSFVAVTSADVAHIVALPATVVGTIIRGYVGANGFELKPPASTGINGGVGSDFSSAIGADLYWEVIAVSATQLLGSTMTVAGVKAAMAVAD